MSDSTGNKEQDAVDLEGSAEMDAVSAAMDAVSAAMDPVSSEMDTVSGEINAAVSTKGAGTSERVLERTRETADFRRAEAARRYDRAAQRGSSDQRSKRRRRERIDALAAVSRRLDRLPLTRALEVTLVLAVVGSLLAVGSVHPAVMAIVGGVSTLTLVLALLVRDHHSPRIVGPAMVCWALAAWCLAQMIPLPMSWLEAFAPANADIWRRALLPFGEAEPMQACISLDPGATAIEALRWFSYGAIFVAAAQVACARGARWVLTLVYLTAVLTALVTLGHGLAGMTKLYGIYAPSFKATPWHMGPLLNGNNLAGLLNLGAMCGLGLMLSDTDRGAPWLLLTGVAVIVGVDVISASRGGVALLLAGIVLLAITVELPNRRRNMEPPVGRARFMVAATVFVGGALALLGGRSALWTELLDENLDKLRMVGQVEPAVSDFPFVGMGRGAFESVFSAYQLADGRVVFTHAENFIAQWVVEWGAPAAILALLALGFFFRPKRMGVRQSSLAAAAWIGITIVLLQNLLDLGLEVPGLCIALAATAGATWGDPDLYREPSRPAVSKRRVVGLALGALTVGTVLSLGGYALGRHGVAADRLQLHEQLIEQQPPRSAAQVQSLVDGLRAAMLRHPAEPYFALLGAELTWEEQSGDTIPWLQRTLERSAANGKAHLLLARVLWRHGSRLQALLELRLAAEAEPRLVDHTAKQAAKWTADLEELQRAAPNTEHAASFWQSLGGYLTDRRVASMSDQRAIALDPRLLAARQRLVDDVIRQREEGGCVGDAQLECAAEIERHATLAEKQSPSSSLAARMRASWLAAVQDPVAGEALLAKVCEGSDDTVVCLRARAAIAAKVPTAEPFGQAAKTLRRAACAKRDACGAVNVWIGDRHMTRKEHALAVTSYEKAVREHATEERLERLATAAIAAGLSSRAARALERLLERTTDPAKKTELQRKRRAVMRRMLR